MFLLSCHSWGVRKKLQKLFTDTWTSYDFKIVFTSFVRVQIVFSFKDRLPKMLLSGLD